jgi:hypothetical protein
MRDGIYEIVVEGITYYEVWIDGEYMGRETSLYEARRTHDMYAYGAV